MENVVLSRSIKSYRTDLGLSQRNFAKLFGVTRQQVSRWETARAWPSNDNFVRMLTLFPKFNY